MDVSESPESCSAAGRQPWLAASLSWLFPGMGQLYCGAYARAAGFVVLWSILQAGGIVFLLSDRLSTNAVLVLCILMGIPFSICVCVDAFRTTRKRWPVNEEWKRISNRNPYFAVVLTLLLTGAGHLYMRRWVAGTVFLVADLVLHIPALRSRYAGVAILVLWVLAPGHLLATCAVQSGKTRWRAAWPTVGPIAACYLAGCGLALVYHLYLVFPMRPTGISMVPTIVRTSFVIEDKLTYRFREPVVGDIVSFTPPKHPDVPPGVPYCKRIVASGGQTIQVRDGFVFIDGGYKEPAPIHGPFPLSRIRASEEISRYPFGVAEPYRVPKNHYFVLGDNRDYSLDSRVYGPVPRESIIARVARVYTLPYFRRAYDRGRGYRD